MLSSQLKRLFAHLFLDLDNLHTTVSATGWADVMVQPQLVALRAGDEVGPFQRVMSAALASTCLGNPYLR
jgi:hypothetical protein